MTRRRHAFLDYHSPRRIPERPTAFAAVGPIGMEPKVDEQSVTEEHQPPEGENANA